MQASTSQQLFCDNKTAKNFYQKINASEKKDETLSIDIKSVNSAAKNEVKEDSLKFVNLKDFPELKASGKVSFKRNSENCNSGSKNVKSWSSAVSKGNKKNFRNEAFPVLSGVENFKTKNFYINVEKNTETDNNVSALSEINSRIVADRAVFTNIPSKGNTINSLKKTPEESQKKLLKKKKTDPIFINFQDVLVMNKVLRRPKNHKILKTKVLIHKNKELLFGNILDSSNPKRSRGKKREIKKKKLSKFKATILKERILKHRIKETTVNYFGSESFNETDFKVEIKDYLNKLSERKLKNLENSKNKLNQNTNVENTEDEGEKKVNPQLVTETEGHKKIPFMKKQIPQIGPDKEIRFSSKFREYCDNIITPELNSSVIDLIKEIIELQDRLFLKDPIKAKAKKRHVSGIREVRKYLNLKKIKMIIIAPNLEKLQMEGSVYDSIEELKSMAGSQNVPYGFALNRYKLGKCTKKNVPVSAFGILNYEGLENLYEKALSELLEAKRQFSELLVSKKVVEDTDNITSKLISDLVSAFREDLKVSSEDQLHLD